MLLLLGVCWLLILYIEGQDNKCSGIYFTRPLSSSSSCHPGDGPFKSSLPSTSDSCETLISKVKDASSIDQRSVKWRRSIIYSTVICVLLFVFVLKEKMEWTKLYLSIFVSSAFLYLMFNYYSYHVSSIAAEHASDALDIMKRQCFK